MPAFLDRLMVAESDGRADARNPRSTAVGPYQFIEGTWFDVVQRSYGTETRAMTPAQILALRSDAAFSRRVAETYTKENAAVLAAAGVAPTFPHLRLAHLLGPQGAVRVLNAPPQSLVSGLLGASTVAANPFLVGMTVERLVARAARDLAVDGMTRAGVAAGDLPPLKGARRSGGRSAKPGLLVRCNLDLPACRRWKSLAIMRLPSAKPVRKQLALARTR